MTIGSIVSQFLAEERSVAVLLPPSQVEALAISAVAFYCGYNDLSNIPPNPQMSDITKDVVVTLSEWVVIRPLFLLYVERETALQIEATGMQGVTGYGRNSSEVNSEISRLEESFAQQASCQKIITIGGDEAANWDGGSVFPYGFNYYY